jgi:hypothetical protein
MVPVGIQWRAVERADSDPVRGGEYVVYRTPDGSSVTFCDRRPRFFRLIFRAARSTKRRDRE